QRYAEPWRVTLVDTGEHSQTGGRLARVARYLENEKDFFFTYGDGLGDVDLTNLVAFHRAKNRLATVTAVAPPGRFGTIELANDKVARFKEKPATDGSLINGGFFVLSPKAIERVESDSVPWEGAPMESLVRDGQLSAFHHKG